METYYNPLWWNKWVRQTLKKKVRQISKRIKLNGQKDDVQDNGAL